MHRPRMGISLLGLAAVMLAGCGRESVVTEPDPPAVVEELDGTELSRITLTATAAERLGVGTAVVEQQGSRVVVPYAAVLYDSDGATWAYVSPAELVFVREPIVVDRIVGDRAVLREGPPSGTVVATTGAAELYGAETGVGGGH